jgi:uncharacterized protein (TIGR03067 family)
MMSPCVLVILAGILTTDQAKPTGTRPEAKTELKGSWNVLVWDDNGTWLSASKGGGDLFRDVVVEFTNDRVTLKPRDRDAWSYFGMPFTWIGAYKISPTKDLKEIDVTVMEWPLDGKEGSLTDQVWRGIYALRGDKLTICIDCSYKSRRPTRFGAEPKRSHIILLLERKKEDKKKGDDK